MTATILIVDDEENARENISQFLAGRGYEVIGAATMNEARQYIHQAKADVVLLDVALPDGYGPDLLEETARLDVRPPIILITAYGDIDMAVNAMKNGAVDFLTKPINLIQLEKSIQPAVELVALRREVAYHREQQKGDDYIVGTTPRMQTLMTQAQRAAEMSVSVLITGESGTGKEGLAKAIHKMGPRAGKPMMAIDCGSIQNTMVEAELFGYEAGAFTGAEKRKPGLMEVADGGVLFLDEISSMSPDMQAKLLRALEERAFRRMGGTTLIKVDVQVLAASNRDLPTMIAEDRFRRDLYYRLKVVDLHLPLLRERKEDIPTLAGMFIRKNNMRMGLNIQDITPRALQALVNYSWPGNIRELRNVLERSMLFCYEACLDMPHLPPEFQQ